MLPARVREEVERLLRQRPGILLLSYSFIPQNRLVISNPDVCDTRYYSGNNFRLAWLSIRQ